MSCTYKPIPRLVLGMGSMRPLHGLQNNKLYLVATLQLVTDFAQQLNVFRRRSWSCRRCFFLLAEGIHALDDKEDTEGNDEEVNSRLYEVTPIQFDGFLDGLASSIDFGGTKDELGVAEATARDQTDRRHDDVVNKRSDDLTEGTTDDDTDSHIHYITLEGKIFELLNELSH